MKRKKSGQPFNEMKKSRRKKNDSHMAMKKGTEFLNKKLFLKIDQIFGIQILPTKNFFSYLKLYPKRSYSLM